MNRRLIMAGALLVPVLVFVSCKDDGNSNPVGPNTPNAPSAKVAPSVRQGAARSVNVAGRVAKLAAEVSTATTVTGPAPHDPTVNGVRLVCFSGVDVGPPFPGPYGGIGFTWRNNKGCELNNFSGASDPDGTVSGAFPASRSPYTGKLLTAIRNLTYYYAGGPQLGGAPRLNIPIDECESVTPLGITTMTSSGCPVGSATDGFFDGTAFTDNSTCHDGDPYVGAVKVVHTLACNINYRGTDYPNWAAFKAAFPGARIARKYDGLTSGTGRVEPADILILADQVVHFHVHRALFN